MQKQTLSGSIGIAVFIVALISVCVAFATPAWLVSDYRITGANLDKLGLWSHCFRSLRNPQDNEAPQQFFVGCRWVYDPFTSGYDQIRGFLLPPFMIVTQTFFTICFLLALVCFGFVLLYTLCCDAEQQRYVQLIQTIGYLSLTSGASGCLAVIVFASLGNTDGWMPGHINNFFGWSFVLAIIGSVLMVLAAILLLVEANVQRKKREHLKESQTRFQMETKS